MKYFYLSVAIGALIRLIGLDVQSLWSDELSTVIYANSHSLGELYVNWLTQSWEANPPFYYTFLYFWVKIFGESPVSVRLPSAIAGILSIYYMYRYVKIYFSEEIAIMSSIMLSLSYASLYYSQEARAYSFLILFSILSTFYWLKLQYRKSYKTNDLIKYIVLINLAAYTHYFGLLLVCIQLSYWIFHSIYNKHPLKYPSITILLFLLAYSPWIFFMINTFTQHGGGNFWIEKPTLNFYIAYLSLIFRPNQISFSLLVLAPLFIHFKYHIFNLVNLAKKHFSINSSLFAVAFIIVFMIISSHLISLHTPILYPRNLLGIAPLIYLLLSIWINLSAINKKNLVSYVFFSCLFLLLLFLPPYYNNAHKYQFREVALYAIEEANYDSVIYANQADFYNYYFRYFNYVDKEAYDNLNGVSIDDVENFYKELMNLGAKELIILEGHDPLDKMVLDLYENVSKKYLKINYLHTKVHHFTF